jgi:pimeloyl-ACP methyl ester carboxylesterase
MTEVAAASDAELRETFVQSGDVRLKVVTCGQGPPVLLLHGFPDSWRLWYAQITALAGSGYRVIAPDLRGHGESDRPTAVDAYRIPVLMADIRNVLSRFGVERTAVVGHDWGAALAWSFARRNPDMVEKLSVLSVGHPGANQAAGLRQRQLSWYMLWFLHEGVAEAVLPADDWRGFRDWAWNGAARGSDPLMDRQLAELSRPGALTAALNLYRANIRPENYFSTAIPAMPDVSCPVLGVWSTGDPFLTEEQMSRSAAYVGGPWRYEVLPGGHWIPVQAAERLNVLLLDFLG